MVVTICVLELKSVTGIVGKSILIKPGLMLRCRVRAALTLAAFVGMRRR